MLDYILFRVPVFKTKINDKWLSEQLDKKIAKIPGNIADSIKANIKAKEYESIGAGEILNYQLGWIEIANCEGGLSFFVVAAQGNPRGAKRVFNPISLPTNIDHYNHCQTFTNYDFSNVLKQIKNICEEILKNVSKFKNCYAVYTELEQLAPFIDWNKLLNSPV
ncbi:hypothetical protein [Celerinatantimonas diazotrophica]|uniref:Uncharacterized protein n=1 Tax=Celerinatantimonas diazotrophica TaxID=412034 RepID=A0A4R1KGY7_9GAMM|nr:hypothetical protein [Celerinatantimonas diazotrophica]TCK63982.1 hypothetical protein EV690_0099 [Celerinatantimonas diazotrophica]CAG9297069.1 hypothetical protein CEDIAZO_02231 [Celerinatantimonas diazotrophica]